MTPKPATSNREETFTFTAPVISLAGAAYRRAAEGGLSHRDARCG
jgi:hypothetical protein